MKKTRLITLIASLCLLAFSFQGACGSHSNNGLHRGGGDASWFDGI